MNAAAALAFAVIAAALGLAGYAMNKALADHTVAIENESDKSIYAALLGRLTLLCRETAFPFNTGTQCLWVKVAGVGRSFRFYSSVNPSCSPDATVQVNFLDDHETIQIISPGLDPISGKARMIVAEVDKFLASGGLACVTE
jgi:hypothetical protein